MSDHRREHGGGIDAALAAFGGSHDEWIDLSTGINPRPYPLPEFENSDWTQLPDSGVLGLLLDAARDFWKVPEGLEILASGGASSLIATIPRLKAADKVQIQEATYNEHAAAFSAAGWDISRERSPSRVVVHPNNPDGAYCDDAQVPDGDGLLVIDESFCDCTPDRSLVSLAENDNVLILKSFGKFWGLAGARLGFAIGKPDLIARLDDLLGPWAVSGPALRVGAQALKDAPWAEETRTGLVASAERMDKLMACHGAALVGGTPLFRLFGVEDAQKLQQDLAQHKILTRVFPYAPSWIRMGLPADESEWLRLEAALEFSR